MAPDYGRSGSVDDLLNQVAARPAPMMPASAPVGEEPPPSAASARPESDRPVASRTSAELRAVFAPRIRDVFSNGLRNDPTTHGAITLRITVDPSGAVTDVVVVSNTLGSPALTRSIIAAVRTARLAPHEGEPTTLVLPFTFSV